MKIFICDDEVIETNTMTSLITQWAATNNYAVDISCHHSAEAFLFAYEDHSDIDILVLDIQMGKMDGVTLAKKIRQTNKTIQIIFATSYMEYIADGYDVEALHYLIKPVDQQKLFAVLDRAMQKLSYTQRTLYVQTSNMSARIFLHEIQYIEVLHNYVTIHAKEDYRIKTTMSKLEKELDENFLRIGRSFIVNVQYVRKVSKDMAWLENGATVPLVRGAYEKLNRAIINAS